MSKFKHLLGGESRVIIGDSETVFLGFMVRLYKLGVIEWVDIEIAVDRYDY